MLEYVKQGLSRIDAGEDIDPARLCAAHPELADAVAEALRLARATPSLQRAADRNDPLCGMVLRERYRLLERVGAGAMGAVYRARDLELERDVAIKILPAEHFANADRRERFRREARALAALSHPHVVPVHDDDQSEQGLVYLVMALLDGCSLAEVLRRAREIERTPAARTTDWLCDLVGSTPPETTFVRLAVRWVAEIASALEAVHRAGLLHRDVKPSNIFITREHRAVLLDFGLVRRDLDPTLTEGVIGTPHYMAPEQARGSEAMGPPTDVYGLTATLYHSITLRCPFEGSGGEVIARLLRDDPTPARKLVRGLPRDLEAILDKGLERSPLRRYASMHALAHDLHAFLEGRPVSVRPLSPLGRLGRTVRRRPARAAATFASLVAAGAAVIALLLFVLDQARARREESLDLRARIPLRAGVEGTPEERPRLASIPRERTLNLLGRIIELDPRDAWARLLRAALLLDRGESDDHAHAASDMRAVADAHPSPYLIAVAARYAAFDPQVRGAKSVDCSALGVEPESAEDKLVAAFHALRYRNDEGGVGFTDRAYALLADAPGEDLSARELRLVAQMGRAGSLRDHGDRTASRACYDEMIVDARAIEAAYGRTTARTQAAMGRAQQEARRFPEAQASLREALRLAPDEYGEWLNLADLYNIAEQYENAEACLRRAETIRPGYWRTGLQLATTQQAAKDFARALQTAEQLDLPPSLAWKKPHKIGTLYLTEGMDRRDPAMYRTALEHLDRACAEGGDHGTETNRLLAQYLVDGDRLRAATILANHLSQDPIQPYALELLHRILPEDGLDAEGTEAIGTLIHELATALAPQREETEEAASEEDQRKEKE